MKKEENGSANPKKFVAIVNDTEVSFTTPQVTGKDILEKAGLSPVQCYTLYQKLHGCDFEKISLDELLDLSNAGIERFVSKEPEIFNYQVDDEPETTDKRALSPNQVLKLAGISTEEFYLVQLNLDGTQTVYAYTPDEEIKMLCMGMIFTSVKWFDVVDLEEYGKVCKEVPPSRRFKIKVDKNYHTVDGRFIEAEKIAELEKGGKAKDYDVYKFYSNSPKPIKLKCDDVVDLMEKCLTRFVLMPKEQKDGANGRREFSLPDEDEEMLEKLGLPWETFSRGSNWLIIQDYPLPTGYNVESATLALQIPPNYAVVQIDMAYFFPPLTKISGKGINATSTLAIDNKTFQQWSRHRNAGEWTPGLDNVSTHLTLVDNWLVKDLER